MDHNHPTTEELEAENLFKQATLPTPDRELAQSIITKYQPVTTTIVDRIHKQEQEYDKGRTNIFFNLHHILMSWKKIIPIGALAALLVLAFVNKPETTQTPSNQTKLFETKISAGPLSDSDIEIAIDELAAELNTEESWDDESIELAAADSLVNFEPIYQTYELY